jgi:tRNA(Ile)-lysidine synthase
MAALVEHRHARLLRPLLGTARHSLTAMLQERGVQCIDDPSNADLRFERVRIRSARLPVQPSQDEGTARTERERRIAEVAVDAIEVDGGEVSVDRQALQKVSGDARRRLLSRVVQAVGGRDYPPRRDRLERASERLLQREGRGKSGKSQDFTLSQCRLMLRQALPERRLRWIVRPENGTKSSKEGRQPLIPAGFFPCDTGGAPHLDSQPLLGSKSREPVQS